MKIKKNDQVEIIAGKDRGKRGEVLRVFPGLEKVIVKGANVMKRHIRSRRDGEKGQRVEKEMPIHVSNVMLVCPHTDKPTRVGYVFQGGERARMSKQSKKTI
ncbi:MAG: 50S ribosomal protein L24 [Candidatus Moranbacteria bacterium]|nr:50S ribosomal protein L24 [Candidatus Moranbacteria bacterium]